MASVFQRRFRGEHGSGLVFFVAIVIPILFLLLSLALDMSSFYIDRSREQTVLNQAALLGAKSLPFLDSAAYTAGAYARLYSPAAARLGPDIVQVRVAKDEVKVSLQAEVPFPLARFLEFAEPLKFHLAARARVNPKDVVIFFDNSSYLAPPINGEWFWAKEFSSETAGYFTAFLETADVDQAGNWPAATFFRRYPAANQDKPKKQIIYTQQCFNPAFSALKQGAIQLYDYISSFTFNSVAVLSGPKQLGGVFELHPMSAGGFFDGQPEGLLENANYSGVRDQHCLAAAEEAFYPNNNNNGLKAWMEDTLQYEASLPSLKISSWDLPSARMHYGFPAFSTVLDSTRPSGDGRFQDVRITNSTGGLISSNLTLLSARDAIWARTVNRSATINIGAIISQVGAELLNAPNRIETRGALGRTTTTSAYLLLGHFPHQNGAIFPAANVRTAIRSRLRALDDSAAERAKHIILYFVVVRHQGMYPGCQEKNCPEYLSTFANFETFLENIDLSLENLELVALRTPDVSTVALDLMSFLPLTERSTILTD